MLEILQSIQVMRSVDKIKWKIEPVRYLDGKRLCLSLSISYSVYPISFLSFDSWNERCFCFSVYFFCFSFSFIVFWSIPQKTVLCYNILQRYIYINQNFTDNGCLLHSHIYRNYFWMHSNIFLSFVPTRDSGNWCIFYLKMRKPLQCFYHAHF